MERVPEVALNPLALSVLMVMSGVILCATPKSAVKAMLVTAAFVPLGQEIIFFGLHLYFVRILILAGFCRLIVRGEAATFKWVPLDKLLVAWSLVGMVCGILRGPSAETFGAVYDSIGVYFIIRVLTSDVEGVIEHLRALTYVAIVMAACMLWETITHRNPFHLLGGVPEIASERYGRFRAQGPFRHSILAGTFGATLFPLLVGYRLQQDKARWLVLMGVIACAVITVTSASSGPLMCFVVSCVGICLWRIRERMRWIRRGGLLMILVLALVMNAPIWYLIGRLSDVTGGTGWYRSYLIDQAIRHFGQWWLIGTSRTANWAFSDIMLVNADNMDITNHYIIQAIHGGILMLCLFIAMIVVGFRTIGWTIRSRVNLPFHEQLVWAFGVALMSHCMAFISVSYFDQMTVFWFWLLAVIATLSSRPRSIPTPSAAVEA
jgi:hypothetical protein